jgi:hypothetical protein
MFMNDNLVKQIEVYVKIEEYHHKALFIEKILNYYTMHRYVSTDRQICMDYWVNERESLYDFAFRYL